jgi:hypothetical protein
MKKYDNYIYHWTWQILTATVFHSTHVVHKFIGEQTGFFNFKININDIARAHTHTHTHIWQIFTLLKILPTKHNLILKSGISFRLLVSLNVSLHTSQWYGCSPVCTHWCNFRLPMSLNVLRHTSHIISEDPCSLSNSTKHYKCSSLQSVNNTPIKCPISCHKTPVQNDVW